jgi:hypothetical protein
MLYPAAFTASAIAHATLLATLSRTSLTGRGEFAALEPNAVPIVLDLALGLDSSKEESKVWVGFNEPEKHLAALGEVDQAAFTDEPVGEPVPRLTGAANVDSADAAPSPVSRANDEDAQSSSSPPDPESPEPSDESVSDLLGITRLVASNHLLQRPDITEQSVAGTESQPPPSPATQPERPAAPRLDELARLLQQLKEAAEQMHAASEQQSAPSPPLPSAPPSEEAIAMKARSGSRDIGAQSDRESDATSAIDVPREHWQLGKPLAARGLEIKPRRPDVTILTSLTAWPRNPLCRITFQRDGVPKKAELLRNTGDSRVDAAIEASLYRWRAAGKPLEALADGDTIDITIRLVINPERKADASADES